MAVSFKFQRSFCRDVYRQVKLLLQCEKSTRPVNVLTRADKRPSTYTSKPPTADVSVGELPIDSL